MKEMHIHNKFSVLPKTQEKIIVKTIEKLKSIDRIREAVVSQIA